MADKKITELPAATAPTGVELVEIVQGGVNKQTTTQDIADLGGGGGTWGSITGTLSSQTDLNTDLLLRQLLVNFAVALTDGASIDITAIKHTLTSSQGAITFSISYTGDTIDLKIILNATAATYTFPSGALCVSEGALSGDNTAVLSGISGDTYYVFAKKFGSIYLVTIKNFGQ